MEDGRKELNSEDELSKISIVIPVFNGERTVKTCIESVIDQDYSNLEIVVVNDGSTDKTEEIVKRLISKYAERDITLINKKNEGLPQARKTGIDHSAGEFIGFVDADDWIDQSFCSTMMERIRKNNLDMVSCNYYYDYENHTFVQYQKLLEDEVYSNREALSAVNNRYGVFQYVNNKLIRKKLFQKIKFFHGNFAGEDYSILFQLLLQKCSVGIVNKPLYHYNQNGDSMVNKGYGSAQILGFQNYLKILRYIHGNYDIAMAKEFDNYMVNEFMGIVLTMGNNGVYDYERIKWIQQFLRKRLIDILANKYNTVLCKGTTIVMCINYRIVVLVYRLYRVFLVKWK